MERDTVGNIENDVVENKKVFSEFADTVKTRGIVFKATPNIVNRRNSDIVSHNMIIIVVLIALFLIGVGLKIGLVAENGAIIAYISDTVMLFSSIMVLVLMISVPHTLYSYNSKVYEIYLEINTKGLSGITIDGHGKCVCFDNAYEEIQYIYYNSKTITIILKNGNYFDYDVFYNPREIYAIMSKMSGGVL